MSSAYDFAPLFLIRMAGVPFDHIERVATPQTSAAARDLLVRQEALAAARSELEGYLRLHREELAPEIFRAWKKAARSGSIPPPLSDPLPRPFSDFSTKLIQQNEASGSLDQSLARELPAARTALAEAARSFLPRYLVFTDRELRERLQKEYSDGPLPPRNKQARAHERHLLLYVQRVCAKNDSLSEFGPEGWGTISPGDGLFQLAPRPGIAARETFLERWTAHGAAAALNADPEVRAELAPRLNPNGRLEKEGFLFCDTGETVALDRPQRELLERLDGRMRAYSLAVPPGLLEDLADRRILRWEVEVPALDPAAFATLVRDVAAWRDNSVRKRWLALLEPIADLPAQFARDSDTNARTRVMDEARAALQPLGVTRGHAGNRSLYSAANAIGEECFRECACSVGRELIHEIATEAEPWIDLWRDSYAFVASRVAAGLRHLLQDAPRQDGAVSLPAFLRHCADRKMSLTGPGLVAMAHLAFSEIKAAFREELGAQAGRSEVQLRPEDCHFVRRNFEYPKFDEYTYPSADLQLSARSVAAVARGEYQWVVAELHPPVALLHHSFYWSCPDKAGLAQALSRTAHGQPNFHFGFFAADFTSATAVHMAEATPDLFHFVAPQRPGPGGRAIPPSETEIYVAAESGDVRLRRRDSKQDLGSFARAWLIPLGFHPFSLSLGPETPRLLCGKVVVQRRAWTVQEDEVGIGDFTGVSRDLILAVEQLRLRKGWPRHIYIRPTEQALRRSGAEGRDKDTKPVFIDLESYLFLEVFFRWLKKAGELEVTEMLPDAEHLLWSEADGRRSFELRTQIVPRS